MRKLAILVFALASILLCLPASAQQKKIKVIADQDSAGPQGTNFLSLLMLLRAPQIDLLGITTVSGDQWVEPATVFALWATEQAGRTDVPVIKGAERPLVNTKRDTELREALYGSYVEWHGSFNPDAPKPSETWAPPGGFPKVRPRPGRAADFIIDIMIPIVARTSEDVLRLVPKELREASLALGATEARTILRVVLPAARNGIITGIVLAMARVAGETAPLLMTAFGTTFWNSDITQPTDALPLRIFNFTLSPYQVQINQAYAGSFVLILLILIASFSVRWVTGGFKRRVR